MALLPALQAGADSDFNLDAVRGRVCQGPPACILSLFASAGVNMGKLTTKPHDCTEDPLGGKLDQPQDDFGHAH